SPSTVARSSPAWRSGTAAFRTGFPSTTRPFTDSSSPRCTSPVKSIAPAASAVAPARWEPTSTAENVPPLSDPLSRSTTTSLGEKVAASDTSWNTPCPTTSNWPPRRRAFPSGFGFPKRPLTLTCASSVPPVPRSRGATPARTARPRWRAAPGQAALHPPLGRTAILASEIRDAAHQQPRHVEGQGKAAPEQRLERRRIDLGARELHQLRAGERRGRLQPADRVAVRLRPEGKLHAFVDGELRLEGEPAHLPRGDALAARRRRELRR